MIRKLLRELGDGFRNLEPAMIAAAGVALVLGGLFALAIVATTRTEGDRVDRESYAAGWQYVVGRQPDGPGAADWQLRTDEGTAVACALYSDGFAQLDGVTDVEDFLAGCKDALRMTDFESTGPGT